jgi:hypothetical protein
MAEVVRHQPVVSEAQDLPQASSGRICGIQSVTGIDSLSVPILRVSIFTPKLHIHTLFTNYPRYVIRTFDILIKLRTFVFYFSHKFGHFFGRLNIMCK